jgi:predicted anti-sigma-YlaC factor YlaD
MSQPVHGFDEALISGYLDRELTQGEAQRVEVHLQDCPSCRALHDELARMKEATMSSAFRVPDDGWDEAPRGRLSRLLRNLGLALGAVVLAAAAIWLVWELAQDPQALMALLVVGGLLISGALLLASVIIDRRAAMKHDKYRRIQR